MSVPVLPPVPESVRTLIEPHLDVVHRLVNMQFSFPIAVAAVTGAHVMTVDAVHHDNPDLVAWLLANLDDPGHPDLLWYVEQTEHLGPWIKHRFVNTMMYSQVYASWLWAARAWRAEDAFNEGNWRSYMLLHETPWKSVVLTELEPNPDVSDSQWWELVGDVWQSAEFQGSDPRWDQIWLSERPGREAAMVDTDQAFYDTVTSSDTVTLYRGFATDDEYADIEELAVGWSWTTTKKQAAWFASRWPHQQPWVASITIPTSLVLAAFVHETEVILNRPHLIDYPDPSLRVEGP